MTSYPDTLQRGDMISCYQIEEVLGRGGFAVTYLAIDLNLDVHVAIKEYLPREIIHRDDQLNVSARRPEFVDDYNIGLSNFAREAKTLARFKHHNIVRVHQVIHKFNTAYMVMDYEHGQEFADVLEEQKTLSEENLREILFPILDGVETIHRAGLAHRDIKPSNIYLRENGSPVLLDFGAARYTMSETTQQLTAVVTVGYTPIEQYNVSDNDQGPWSDIYALAAVLYEAVTGEMPVDSVTRASSTLTNSADPLASVSNKAQQDYSAGFLKAIDWGLHMEAEDRPQSIAQWRAAFNGEFKPASAFVQKKPSGPPSRPSRLKTREKYPLPVDQQPRTPQYQSDTRLAEDTREPHSPEAHIHVDLGANRFDPRFDDSIDDVGTIPLNTTDSSSDSRVLDDAAFDDRWDSNYPEDESDRLHYSPSDITGDTRINPSSQGNQTEQTRIQPAEKNQAQPIVSPFANNPAVADRDAGQAANRRTIEPVSVQTITPDTSTLDDDPPGSIDSNPGQTTHTQQIRNVLRRDIVKRNPAPAVTSAPPSDTPADRDVYPPPYQVAASSNSPYPENRRAPIADSVPPQNTDNRRPLMRPEENTRHNEREPIRQVPIRDEIEFDETDWDYEPPSPPSRWRWLLPTAGLVAIVGGSLLFVNKPELFKFPGAGVPEFTVAGALDKAQQQMADDALIEPAGQSALDYYQLILSSEPDNQQALDGVANIHAQIKRRIIESIDDNDLTEANRLLSRANDSGLQIEGLPVSSDQNQTSQITTTGPTAIDTTPSPWVAGKIADIKQMISEKKYTEADELFNETDKFIADSNLSSSLREQIENGKNTADNSIDPSLSVQDTTTRIQRNVTPAEIAQATLNSEQNENENTFTDQSDSFASSEVKIISSASNSQNSAVIPNTTVPPVNSTFTLQPEQEELTPATTTPNIDSIAETDAEANVPEALPSAPRRSFIEGSGATSRHLNQLRLAIEAKNLGNVLNISDSLPAERTEFLRKMFQRYDRIDVTIGDINNASGTTSARLSVSMFNQRADGSYYSAGRWNGVTLTTEQQNGEWQKIKW